MTNSVSQEKRIKVGVVFGGRSPEHEVSLVSAASVIRALNPQKYEVLPIGITPEGRWLASPDALKLLKEKIPVERYPEHTIVPNPQHKGLMSLNRSLTGPALYHVDVLFPVLHGVFGEDGTIQGLFELAGIPYVGSGVLGSAIGMDKVIQKQLLLQAGIPVAPGLWFTSDEFSKNRKKILESATRTIRYPAFVKPANLGSSIGISKARNVKELETAINLASEYDRKILVEKAVPRAREIECSVLGNDDPVASVPGEIIPSNEFYDYDAKYVDGKSKALVPAKLPKQVVKKIQELSVRAFRILDCAGMARIDFLVPAASTKVFLNEINTIPGFTSISMYPKLWEASGLPYPDLLDRLIQLALERHAARSHLQTAYKPKSGWYKQ
ncbi:MAG: D-alanine--D-alanine ligase family protein [Bacteroidota bacterium]